MAKARPGHPTTQPIAETIETLRNLLFHEYGTNYAFSVAAQGRLLGASDTGNGIIEAVTRKGTSE